MIPEVLDREVLDRVIMVTNTDARSMARRLAREEGVFAGFSSGAAVQAAVEIAEELGRDRQVVVILPDSGERYLGTFLFH